LCRIYKKAILENGHWRDVVLTAVSLALVGYGRWQLLIPTVIMSLIYVLWHWKQWWPKEQRDRLLKLGISAGLTAIFLLPPALLLLQEQRSDPGAANLFREGEETIMQSDLLAYVTPSNGHFLLREVTEPIYDKYYEARSSSRRYSPYIGLTTAGYYGSCQKEARFAALVINGSNFAPAGYGTFIAGKWSNIPENSDALSSSGACTGNSPNACA
jgi:hypothetical protein